MHAKPTLEIHCTACNADTWVVREPVYEGFKKVGDSFVCAQCGHVYASEADVPFKQQQAPEIFDESDRSAAPQVFDEEKELRLCRYCRHYVVNPFTQWCGMHRREVEATDTCDRFERKADQLR